MAFSEQSLSQDAFEHIYQRSYSHGLEKIYALENVDVHSIRKITSSRPIVKQTPSKKIDSSTLLKSAEQLILTFGPPFFNSLPSFIYREPIQVLNLSKRLEQQLLLQDKFMLGDLLDDKQQELIPLKGIGQGHFDEISSKLQVYLEDHFDSENKSTLCITSWLKTLLGDLESKKRAVLLEAFELPSLLLLGPSENAELRKMTSEKRHSLVEEARNQLQTAHKKETLLKDLQQIAEVAIKPWLGLRNDIATRYELHECLVSLSNFDSSTDPFLAFLGEIYFKGNFLFASSLFAVEENLYCGREETAEIYRKSVKIAHSYFYNDSTQYPLDQLIQWISRELASQWINFSDTFIERALRLSSDFRVRKNTKEQLIIKLS